MHVNSGTRRPPLQARQASDTSSSLDTLPQHRAMLGHNRAATENLKQQVRMQDWTFQRSQSYEVVRDAPCTR